MGDLIAVTLSVTVSVGLALLCLAWVTILPSIGALYLLGYLQ